MLALRSSIFYVGYVLFTIFWASLTMVIGLVLPFKQRFYLIVVLWNRAILAWLRFTCRIDYKLVGKANIPDKACVVLSKHQSQWETFFLQTLLYPQATVLKRELLWIPFFGWTFLMLKPIAINRENPRAALREIQTKGKQRLEENIWVLLFPEGTRLAPGKTTKFAKSGASLAIAANKPVLPIAHNSGSHWPAHNFIKYPGTIEIRVGEAIYPDQHTANSLTTAAKTWIDQQVEELSNV